MTTGTGRANVLSVRTQGLAIVCVLVPWMTVAQGLTGALVGTVTDAAGGVMSGAVVRISSPALIGGELTTKTDERGQWRFPSVPPGSYALDIELAGFRPYRDADIRLGAGATIERTPVLTLAALADSVVVHGHGLRLDVQEAASSRPHCSSATPSGWEAGSRSIRACGSTTAAPSVRTCRSSTR